MNRLFVLLFSLGVAQGGLLDQSLSSLFAGSGASQNADVVFQFPDVTTAVLSNPLLTDLNILDDKVTTLVTLLQNATTAVQTPVINALIDLGVDESRIQRFWVNNMFVLKDADLPLLQAASALSFTFTIRAQQSVNFLSTGNPTIVSRDSLNSTSVQWGVSTINATKVWAAGYKGENVIVGIVDSGLNAEHEAIKGRYKNDEFSWFDATAESSPIPNDGLGHGSHVAGSIVGDMFGLGVAPGAKIIACKALDSKGSGTEASLMGCGEWMICPSTPANNCVGRANIVSNSWGGVGIVPSYDSVINAYHAAKMIPVFAIGNSGPNCQTTKTPGNRPKVISVGATDVTDTVAAFSSRGNAVDKLPMLAAPGVDIISASNIDNAGYVKMSGTSMATPHVSGAIALMMSQNPSITYDQVVAALTNPKNVVKPKVKSVLDPTCFGNSAFGAGRIDISKAMNIP